MKVLVTGATGFIGTALCLYLIHNKHSVHYLVTDSSDLKDRENYQGFLWNPENNEIDLNALNGVDAIVNLAGHSINCKWTKENKKLIYESRINCSNTLYNALKDNEHHVKKIIHASAIGIYPSSEMALYTEETSIIGDDFLATVCKDWEEANLRFERLEIATAITRFGLVLSSENGVLHELAKVVSKGFGANLGNGKQWMSWIHYKDVVGIINELLHSQHSGLFNVVAPKPVTQNEFLQTLAKQLNKPLWLPNIPSVFIKIGIGERSTLVLSSQKVKSFKLSTLGYKFKFTTLYDALKDLYKITL